MVTLAVVFELALGLDVLGDASVDEVEFIAAPHAANVRLHLALESLKMV